MSPLRAGGGREERERERQRRRKGRERRMECLDESRLGEALDPLGSEINCARRLAPL